MGRYEEIDFCDTLNDANELPNYDRQLPHSKLQKIYGLWPFALNIKIKCSNFSMHALKQWNAPKIAANISWFVINQWNRLKHDTQFFGLWINWPTYCRICLEVRLTV